MTKENLQVGNKLLEEIDVLQKKIHTLNAAYSVTINNENGFSLISFPKKSSNEGKNFIDDIKCDTQKLLDEKQLEFDNL